MASSPVRGPASSFDGGAEPEPRLKTGLLVQAALRLANAQSIAMVVVRRGDADAGTLLVKVNRREFGVMVLTQVRTAQGEPAWLRATGPAPIEEAAADAYITRQIARDPDLWVIEIDDREGRQLFEGPIL
ncbi:MAG TPA: DUF1491 family protein [Stellaceae bacterium]|nr:DUF1491 family protein [Stellaceae bacterium]